MAGQPSPKQRRWRFSFRVTVVGMFLMVTVMTAAVAVALQYHFSTDLAGESALSSYRQAADRTGDYLVSMDRNAKTVLRLLAADFNAQAGPLRTRNTLDLFAAILRGHASFYAIYFGFPNGDLYDLVNLDSGPDVRHRLMALPQDRWLLIKIGDVDGRHVRRYYNYDARFRLRAVRSEPSTFYSTARPWYVQAQQDVVHKTAPLPL